MSRLTSELWYSLNSQLLWEWSCLPVVDLRRRNCPCHNWGSLSVAVSHGVCSNLKGWLWRLVAIVLEVGWILGREPLIYWTTCSRMFSWQHGRPFLTLLGELVASTTDSLAIFVDVLLFLWYFLVGYFLRLIGRYHNCNLIEIRSVIVKSWHKCAWGLFRWFTFHFFVFLDYSIFVNWILKSHIYISKSFNPGACTFIVCV